MGKVQTFIPDGPCYACTMGEKDWETLTKRLSCKLLGVEEMQGGHTPTNATTSSIIAGVQSQEAIKYLVGKSDYFAFENRVWRMMGEQMTTFFSVVDISEDCPFHYDFEEIRSTSKLPRLISDVWLTAGEQEQAVLSFFDDFICIEGCKKCNGKSVVGFKDLMKRQGTCFICNSELNVELFSRVSKNESIFDMEIVPQFWPLKSLIEFRDQNGSRRYLLERGNQ